MYAFVRFLEDNVCYALPVSCVQNFSPKSRLDFDNQKVYTVYRSPAHDPEDGDGNPGDWGERPLLHKAQILALAEDKTDLENSVMQKKIKIPKLSLNHLEETEETADYGDEDIELRHCKVKLSRAQNFGSSCVTPTFSPFSLLSVKKILRHSQQRIASEVNVPQQSSAKGKEEEEETQQIDDL